MSDADDFLADLKHPSQPGFGKPRQSFTPQESPVEALSRALEEAWDTWRQAADEEAEAENLYEKVYALAYRAAEQDGIAATACREHSKTRDQVVQASCALRIASTNTRTWAKKWDTIHSQHMAALSSQRMVREMS